MEAKETLAHAIIDGSVAQTQEHGGTFNYEYAKTPGNWEYGCYQAVLGWIDQNIHFDTNFTTQGATVSDMPNDIFTTSLANSAPAGGPMVTFTPSGGVQVEETSEWHVTTGVGFSVTEAAEVSVDLPAVGGVSESTSVTFNGSLEVGKTSTHTEQETKQWGQSAEIPPGKKGTFTMVIKRKNIDAGFTATTQPVLNPDVTNTIAFPNDDFQGNNTTKDFQWRSPKQWTHNGTLNAGKGMDVSVTFNVE